MAHLHAWSVDQLLLHLHTYPPRFALAMINPRSLTARASRPPGVKVFDDLNRDQLRVVEMPAGNGIGTARSIAQLYGSAATGGSEIGLSSTVLDALRQPAVQPSRETDTKSYKWIRPGRWVLKARRAVELRFFRQRVRYSWSGRLIRIRDPDTGTGFAYVTNKLRFHLISDPRELALRQALFRNVIGARPKPNLDGHRTAVCGFLRTHALCARARPIVSAGEPAHANRCFKVLVSRPWVQAEDLNGGRPPFQHMKSAVDEPGLSRR
jgi:hypothetical protein